MLLLRSLFTIIINNMVNCSCQPSSQPLYLCLTCKLTVCKHCLPKSHQQHTYITLKHIEKEIRPISDLFQLQLLQYTKLKHQLDTFKREPQLSKLEISNKVFLDKSQGLAQLIPIFRLSRQGKLSSQSLENILTLVQKFGGQINTSRYFQSINANLLEFNSQLRQIVSTMETRILAQKINPEVSSQNISPNNLIRQGPKSGCKKICIKFSACCNVCCGLLTCRCVKCGCCKDTCQCKNCCQCQNCCDCFCNCLQGCCEDDCCCIGSCCECMCQCLQGICECFFAICEGIFTILTCSCDD